MPWNGGVKLIRERFRKIVNKIGKKRLILVSILILIVAIAASTTIAWFTAQSATLTNSFGIAEVTCQIDEEFTDNVKRNVRVQNTGTMKAYIRVALIPLMLDGDDIVCPTSALEDIIMDVDTTTWVYGNDGYYYCPVPIDSSGYTPILINECRIAPSSNYAFELQIVAQAIQALPILTEPPELPPVVEVWEPVTAVNPDDGTLEVTQ